jgi:hypothetical protein
LSNEIKLRTRKNILIFLNHTKKSIENTFLALANSKIKIFSKFKKKNDYLNYLAKFVDQFFIKNTSPCFRKSKIHTPKLKILIKNV